MLLDHFSDAVRREVPWETFHGSWAHVIAERLNEELPADFRASVRLRFGLEVDVGVREREGVPGAFEPSFEPGPPTATATLPVESDALEVWIENHDVWPSLVGAIELVSPANKQSPQERDAFASKCETILRDGAGLMVIDVVTRRRANLHRELLGRIDPRASAGCDSLYATAYKPTRLDQGLVGLDIWEHCLEIGGPLPSLPLPLRVGPTMRVDLAETYRETCRVNRLPLDA